MTAAIQQSDATRIAKLDAMETVLLAAGGAPHFRIYTGAPPARPDIARTGTRIVDMVLPADPFAGAAADGSHNVTKSLQGTWTDAAADATGYGGYYSLEDSAGVCHQQGLISMAWIANYAVSVGHQMHNAGNVYKCTTAGTTSAATPPTGTGTGIVDNTAQWAYAGPVGAVVDNDSIVVNQIVNVTAYTIQDNNL